MSYGFAVPASDFTPLRDGLAEPETTHSGNLVLRVLRENEPGGPVHQIAHIVLTPAEIGALIIAIADSR